MSTTRGLLKIPPDGMEKTTQEVKTATPVHYATAPDTAVYAIPAAVVGNIREEVWLWERSTGTDASPVTAADTKSAVPVRVLERSNKSLFQNHRKGVRAFADCPNLGLVELEEGPEYIGGSGFSGSAVPEECRGGFTQRCHRIASFSRLAD